MKHLPLLGFAVALGFAILPAHSTGEDLSIEQLMAAHVEALGGEEALKEVKTIVRSGDAYIEGDYLEAEGSADQSVVVGKKIHRQLKLDGGGETNVWDGEKGWKDSSDEGLSDVEGKDLTLLEAEANISTLLALWEADGAEGLKMLPDEKLDGELHMVVKSASVGSKLYVHKTTHLLSAATLTEDNPDFGELEIRVSYEDYAEHDGVKLPDAIITDIAEGAFIIGLEFTETKVNAEIDEGLFKKP
jgi:hypothetical protein